ncbi:hypothetical protein H9P43_001733 [Blastocladiella emersonii ATCC 22665]|nr:hypothetical protein H9P43_001733 [Blastocladiella emersonii ATCC 22665]
MDSTSTSAAPLPPLPPPPPPPPASLAATADPAGPAPTLSTISGNYTYAASASTSRGSGMASPVVIVEPDADADAGTRSGPGSTRGTWTSLNDASAAATSPGSPAIALASKLLSADDLAAVERALQKHAPVGDNIMEFGLNIVGMAKTEQFGLVLAMARRMRIPSLLRISYDALLDWVVAVESKYEPNPYHNFSHAVDVAFMCFFTFFTLHASELLTELEMVAVFLAALCHDAGHPGRNNAYMVATHHELAVRYNNQSVLENYSIDLGRALLADHAILAAVSPAARDLFLDLFTDLILATDMSKHFLLVKELGELSQQLLQHDQMMLLAEEEKAASMLSMASLSDHRSGEALCDLPEETSGQTTPTKLAEGAAGSAQSLSSQGVLTSQLAHALGGSHDSPAVSMAPLPSIKMPSASDISTAPAPVLLAARSHSAEGGLDTNTGATITFSASGSRDFAPGPETATFDDDPLLVEYTLLQAPQRRSLIKALLHAADISNTVRPWELCKRWSDLVELEHFAQGDAELAAGLPVSPNMDRTACQQAKVSIDFSDIIIQPFFVLLADVLPGTELYLDQLAVNRTLWEQLRERAPPSTQAGVSRPGSAGRPELPPIDTSVSVAVAAAEPLPPSKAGTPISKPVSAFGTPDLSASALHSPRTPTQRPQQQAHPGSPLVAPGGRRVSVAAGTIVIPEHYFHAASAEASPTASNISAAAAAAAAAAATAMAAGIPIPTTPHTSGGAAPIPPVPPLPVPTPAGGRYPGWPQTSEPGATEDFDALYLAYLARAHSRRRAAPRSVSPGPMPLADPTAYRRYSLEASERQRRRKSTIQLRGTASGGLLGSGMHLGAAGAAQMSTSSSGLLGGPGPGPGPPAPSRRAASLDTSGLYFRQGGGGGSGSSGGLPPVPPVPAVFVVEGFRVPGAGPDTTPRSEWRRELLEGNAEPREPASTPVTAVPPPPRTMAS